MFKSTMPAIKSAVRINLHDKRREMDETFSLKRGRLSMSGAIYRRPRTHVPLDWNTSSTFCEENNSHFQLLSKCALI